MTEHTQCTLIILVVAVGIVIVVITATTRPSLPFHYTFPILMMIIIIIIMTITNTAPLCILSFNTAASQIFLRSPLFPTSVAPEIFIGSISFCYHVKHIYSSS